ncbi:hypothetical protein [uncultured Reyranella sp.]|uniref:hypothetical protein n=1 Tax=uncultured Reyranella sp. TaxID=735512 RepID=UPI0025D7C0BB|nr:hypothetical protein [uncultured Reyranella sp.]
MPSASDVATLVFDSVTKLPPEADGAVVIGASHAAVYAAYMSAKFGCRAAIHHDAGIGKDEAGVSGLAYADRLGMAMAAVATASARIGDGADLQARGIISRANGLAMACGVVPGMQARQAAELLKQARWPHTMPPAKGESRHERDGAVCADSATLLVPGDRGRVVATGSHGALNSYKATAPFRPLLLMFNDAGFGADRGGVLALPELDKEGIAALAVATQSARIGDGRSTLQDGTISDANEAAYRLGARVGGSALALARALAEKSGQS